MYLNVVGLKQHELLFVTNDFTTLILTCFFLLAIMQPERNGKVTIIEYSIPFATPGVPLRLHDTHWHFYETQEGDPITYSVFDDIPMAWFVLEYQPKFYITNVIIWWDKWEPPDFYISYKSEIDRRPVVYKENSTKRVRFLSYYFCDILKFMQCKSFIVL